MLYYLRFVRMCPNISSNNLCYNLPRSVLQLTPKCVTTYPEVCYNLPGYGASCNSPRFMNSHFTSE